MALRDRYTTTTLLEPREGGGSKTEPRWDAILRDGLIVLACLIFLPKLWPFYSVPTGSRGVVTQFGKIVGIEQEGLAVLPPWQNLTLFSIRAEEANIENASGATSDTQPVSVSLTVRYSISPEKVSEVYEKYSHNGDLSSYVQTATHEIFKAVTARYSAPDLIAQRAKVSTDIYAALGSKLAVYGAQVINIDMRNFAFQDSYMRAINSKVEQEQLRLAAENKLRTVEAEQKQKVAIAQAEADAVKATADGNAYANLKIATAQAEALKVQNSALAQNKDVLELRRIEVEQTKADRWNGQLPQNVYAGAPIPFLNVSK
jgi:regulator of protease activity HflC (stomatin/prohibitin superfamily)